MMKTLGTIALGLLLFGCSNVKQAWQSAREDQERARQEYQKVEQKVLRNHESICFNGRVKSLDLFYGFQGNGPQSASQTLPRMEPDLLRSIVQKTGRFHDDAELEQALSGPVNDALNSRLPMLNDGTYNTIYVRIGQKGYQTGHPGYLGITPGRRLSESSADDLQSKDRPASLLVWVPESAESRKKDLLGRMLEGVFSEVFVDDSVADSVWAFDDNLVITGDQGGIGSRFREHVGFPSGRYPARCTSKSP